MSHISVLVRKAVNTAHRQNSLPSSVSPPIPFVEWRSPLFHTSVAVKKEIVDLAGRYAVLIGSYRRFGTTFRFHLQGVDFLTDWMSPATSVNNYQIKLRNISEERRSRISICLLLSCTPLRLVYRLSYANVCHPFLVWGPFRNCKLICGRHTIVFVFNKLRFSALVGHH